jgi:hypothetical protein
MLLVAIRAEMVSRPVLTQTAIGRGARWA